MKTSANARMACEVRRRKPRTRGGFTLIELLVVMVIIGIMASIGYPSYLNYVERARRTEAKGFLSEIQARMERYYFDNESYTTDMRQLGFATTAPESEKGNYVATSLNSGLPTGNIATSYLIRVTPTGPHVDPDCGYLQIDSRNQQSSATGQQKCWKK